MQGKLLIELSKNKNPLFIVNIIYTPSVIFPLDTKGAPSKPCLALEMSSHAY